jgi:hypothetical protein
MSGSIGSRAIAGRAFGDGTELDAPEARDAMRIRARAPVSGDRYPVTAPPEATEAKTPIYDNLNPDQRSAVDRMIVAVRLSNMRGVS